MKGADGGMVDVAEEKVVNGPVPVPSECIPRGTVPPIRVKPPVREPCDFREDVELGQNVSVKQHKMIEDAILITPTGWEHSLHIPKLRTYGSMLTSIYSIATRLNLPCQ